MVKNDKKIIQATQVAYLNCIEKGEKNLILNGKKGPFTVKDLILATINEHDIKDFMEADGYDKDNITIQKMVKYSDLSQRDKDLIAQLDNEVLTWKIVDIHDTTIQNGFYGCVMETSNNEAIVGIRGSEGFEDYAGAIHDWVEADFGLLNNEKTIQTEETERYAKILAEQKILDKYDKIDVCGHSLGGNLASHFAVVCASNKDTEEIYNRLNEVYNCDGPGVSDEYLNKNKTAIQKVASKITHFKWSPVGSLLYNLPGEKEKFLKIREYYGDGNIKDKIGYYTFGKHDTRSLVFDKEGNAEPGKEDILSKSLRGISLGLEQFPTVTTSLYNLAASTIGKMIYQKENGKIGFKLPFMETPEDDYRNYPITYKNLKIRSGYLVNGIVERVKDYATNIYEKIPTMQINETPAVAGRER